MRHFLFTAITLTVVAPVFAQTSTCNPEQQDCTVGEAITFYRNAAVGNAQTAATSAVQSLVAKDVVNTNRATTAPPSFAARFHNSYEDFLNLFSFAINKVEETKNGQAFIVRFNPLRNGDNLVGTSLTITESAVSEVVRNAIPPEQRDAAVSALEKQISDTSDLTWAVAYSMATANCDVTRPATQRCWGRSPSAYRDLLGLVLLPLIQANDRLGDIFANIMGMFPPAAGRLESRKLSEAGANRMQVLTLIRQGVEEEAKSVADAKSLYRSHHLELLPKLIDNQPQVSLNGTYHKTGAFGGPRERAASVEIHFGSENINTIRTACEGKTTQLAACLQQQIDALATTEQSPTKYVVTATYQKPESYHVAALPLQPPVTFQPVDLKSSSEYHLKGQLGQQLSTQITGKAVHADGSVEFTRTQMGSVRSQNRFVGILTFSVPLGENITLPVSLTYANKPEFLGDVTDHLGAHVGLSYRLPNLFGSK